MEIVSAKKLPLTLVYTLFPIIADVTKSYKMFLQLNYPNEELIVVFERLFGEKELLYSKKEAETQQLAKLC